MLHELLAGVVRTGEAFWAQDLLFEIERYGFEEETYFDVLVRPGARGVGRASAVCTASSPRPQNASLSERRMALLNDLAAHNATARTARDACVLATETLAARPQDITFALAYLDDELQSCTPGAEAKLAAREADLIQEFPLFAVGRRCASGRLIVGSTRGGRWTISYRAFLDLVAGQLGTALSNAHAYEQKRTARRGARRDRSREDGVLQQREPRVPHAADAAARPRPGCARLTRAIAGADALATVNRNALRLLKLVNTLLDFARIEAGRADANYEPTDLATFTADLASAFRSAVESAGLQFDVDCAPLDEPVDVDRSMWEKIVFNLLPTRSSSRSRDTFASRSLERSGDAVRLYRSDTGIGIAADQLPHVFERFHRVRGAAARTHEGTGIGLALVQELVRLHGGKISVDSRVGHGSIVHRRVAARRRHLAQNPSPRHGRSRRRRSVPTHTSVKHWGGWGCRRRDPASAAVGICDSAHSPGRR